MFTAIARYYFRPEVLEEAVALWEAEVLERVQAQPGFVGVELFVHPEGQMLAIGSWEAAADAQAFMATGIFKTLTERFAPLMTRPPEQGPWEQRHFIHKR